ncbi:MAG: hypothetical protein QOE90_3030, partial [Thermoplasmata archaeon]|nr:hypothetical protein [Thermoplasmata archaeon]
GVVGRTRAPPPIVLGGDSIMGTVGFAGLFPARAIRLESRTLVLTLSAQAALLVLHDDDRIFADLVPARSKRWS